MGKPTVHLELFEDQAAIFDEEAERLNFSRASFADHMFREWFNKRKIDYPTRYGRRKRKREE